LRERAAVERRRAASNGFDGISELARRHRPELLRRKVKHAQANADRLFPREWRHAPVSPNVAWISSAAMRT
jgi:hypothetical protein